MNKHLMPQPRKLRDRIRYTLTPSFLSRFERWLLLNQPLIWSTRVHRFAWGSILAIIVLCTLSFVFSIFIPIEFMSELSLLFFLFLLMEGVVLLMSIEQGRSIEREYGQTSIWRVYQEIGLYALCAFFAFAPSLCVLQTIKINLARRFDRQQMATNIADADANLSGILTQIRTEYPQAVIVNPSSTSSSANSSLCGQVTSYAKALEELYPGFIAQLAIDNKLLREYPYSFEKQTADFITSINQLQSYCSRLDTVRSMYDFVFLNSSTSNSLIYIFHVLALFSGWFLLNLRYDSSRFIGIIGAMGVISAIIFMSTSGIEIAISLAFDQTILRGPSKRLLWVLAIITTIVTITIARMIFTINDRQIFNRRKADLIATFPVLLIAATVFVNIAFESSILAQILSALGLITGLILVLPVLKSQLNKLYSLPTE